MQRSAVELDPTSLLTTFAAVSSTDFPYTKSQDLNGWLAEDEIPLFMQE
jgi:hypothetical protein